jgi:hypothetical protein
MQNIHTQTPPNDVGVYHMLFKFKTDNDQISQYFYYICSNKKYPPKWLNIHDAKLVYNNNVINTTTCSNQHQQASDESRKTTEPANAEISHHNDIPAIPIKFADYWLCPEAKSKSPDFRYRS